MPIKLPIVSYTVHGFDQTAAGDIRVVVITQGIEHRLLLPGTKPQHLVGYTTLPATVMAAASAPPAPLKLTRLDDKPARLAQYRPVEQWEWDHYCAAGVEPARRGDLNGAVYRAVVGAVHDVSG